MSDDFMSGFLAGQSDSNNGGFFGNEGLWAVIILAIIFGWGRNGSFGGGSCGGDGMPYVINAGGWGGSGGFDAAVQRGFDNSAVITKLNGIENGLCSLGYDQLAQMNGINANIAAGFAGVNNAICTLGYQAADLAHGTNLALMQGFTGVQAGQTALSTQLAQCCCDNKAMLADLKYTMANQTRDIMDGQAAGFRAVLDDLCKLRIEQKDDKIASMAQYINKLELAASQSAQNDYIVDRLTPKAPIAAFTVPAPWQYGSCNNQGCC